MNERPADSSPGELVLGVLGALVTLAVIGFLAFQALAVREGDPLFHVEVIAVEQTAQGFVTEVRVRNDGGTTAEAVHLVGTAGGGGSGGQAIATISYVPPHSSRRATLVFPTPPGPGGVEVRVAGYTSS